MVRNGCDGEFVPDALTLARKPALDVGFLFGREKSISVLEPRLWHRGSGNDLCKDADIDSAFSAIFLLRNFEFAVLPPLRGEPFLQVCLQLRQARVVFLSDRIEQDNLRSVGEQNVEHPVRKIGLMDRHQNNRLTHVEAWSTVSSVLLQRKGKRVLAVEARYSDASLVQDVLQDVFDQISTGQQCHHVFSCDGIRKLILGDCVDRTAVGKDRTIRGAEKFSRTSMIDFNVGRKLDRLSVAASGGPTDSFAPCWFLFLTWAAFLPTVGTRAKVVLPLFVRELDKKQIQRHCGGEAFLPSVENKAFFDKQPWHVKQRPMCSDLDQVRTGNWHSFTRTARA